jgi:putative resolvase
MLAQQGMSYSTARRPRQARSLSCAEAKPHTREDRVAFYTHVSCAEHRENLERQVKRLVKSCTVRGYQVTQMVKAIASCVTESRPKWLALRTDDQTTRIVVEHTDRLTRFGFRYLETL